MVIKKIRNFGIKTFLSLSFLYFCGLPVTSQLLKFGPEQLLYASNSHEREEKRKIEVYSIIMDEERIYREKKEEAYLIKEPNEKINIKNISNYLFLGENGVEPGKYLIESELFGDVYRKKYFISPDEIEKGKINIYFGKKDRADFSLVKKIKEGIEEKICDKNFFFYPTKNENQRITITGSKDGKKHRLEFILKSKKDYWSFRGCIDGTIYNIFGNTYNKIKKAMFDKGSYSKYEKKRDFYYPHANEQWEDNTYYKCLKERTQTWHYKLKDKKIIFDWPLKVNVSYEISGTFKGKDILHSSGKITPGSSKWEFLGQLSLKVYEENEIDIREYFK